MCSVTGLSSVCVRVEVEGDVDHFESLLGDDRSRGEGEGEGSEEEGEGESGSQSVDEENPEEVEDMGMFTIVHWRGAPAVFISAG